MSEDEGVYIAPDSDTTGAQGEWMVPDPGPPTVVTRGWRVWRHPMGGWNPWCWLTPDEDFRLVWCGQEFYYVDGHSRPGDGGDGWFRLDPSGRE